MSVEQPTYDAAALNLATRDVWDQNAEFWDRAQGDAGNRSQRTLIGPAVERLLALHPGEAVLEIACGTGVFARQMAQLGVQMLATDFSTHMLEHARARTTDLADRIEYRLLDATNEEHLLALGVQRFDAAVCNMGLMDMASIDPLCSALKHVLKPGGRFVFSVTHPCFNNGGKLVLEEEDREGEIVTTAGVKISRYLTPTAHQGVAIIGQPAAQYYFERPLHVLFTSCFRAGFALDGLEEPSSGPEQPGSRPLSWATLNEIPPFLVARMRLFKPRG
ncbi:MAG TPA: class I SAM-dependent methyltransferase [Ktedonobacterales bacterium]|nr:class I SAM-dependent methyltransferase [Ktedonobacterales bacterium]